jgi:hypothetical protein
MQGGAGAGGREADPYRDGSVAPAIFGLPANIMQSRKKVFEFTLFSFSAALIASRIMPFKRSFLVAATS